MFLKLLQDVQMSRAEDKIKNRQALVEDPNTWLTMTFEEIRTATDYSEHTLQVKSRAYNPNHTHIPQHDIDWSEIDHEGVSLDKLAEELGVSKSLVQYHRKRKKAGKTRKRVDWSKSNIDYEKTNKQLAKLYGYSERTIATKRKENT